MSLNGSSTPVQTSSSSSVTATAASPAAAGSVADSKSLGRASVSGGNEVTLIYGDGQATTLAKQFNVSILDTKLAEQNKQKYTEYILQYEASDSKDDIAVPKRFSELHDFNEALSRKFVCLPPFPPKTLFRSTDPEFVENRKKGILNYLRLLMLRNDVNHSKAIQKFLGVNTPAAPAAGAKDAKSAPAAAAAAATPAAEPAAAPVEVPVSASGAALAPVAGSEATAAAASSTDVDEKKPEGGSAHGSADEDKSAADSAVGSGQLLGAMPPVKKDDLYNDHGHAAESSPFDAFTPHNPFSPAAAAAAAAESDPFAPPKPAAAAAAAEPAKKRPSSTATPASTPATRAAAPIAAAIPIAPAPVVAAAPVVADSKDAAAAGSADGAAAAARARTASMSITDSSRPSLIKCPAALWSHSLELTMKLPVFAVTKALIVEQNTIVVSAGNNSSLAQMEVYLDHLFQRSAKKQTSPAPLGGLYAFRRSAADGVYSKTLNMLFARNVTDFAWDAGRRWLYIVHDEGELQVYNPSPEWDYAIKISNVQLYEEKVGVVAVCYKAPKNLFSISDDGQLTGYDVDGQRVAAKYSYKTSKLAHVIYDERNGRVFLGTFEGAIFIFQYHDSQFKLVTKLMGHEGSVRCLSYDDRSGLLVSGSFDQTLIVWSLGETPGLEAANAKQIGRLYGHPSRVKCVAFNASGTMIVSGDAAGHVALWDVKQMACLLAFKAHADGVTSVELTHDYQLLTASTDQCAKFWQLGE